MAGVRYTCSLIRICIGPTQPLAVRNSIMLYLDYALFYRILAPTFLPTPLSSLVRSSNSSALVRISSALSACQKIETSNT